MNLNNILINDGSQWKWSTRTTILGLVDTISTGRLLLRDIALSDAQGLLRIYADAERMKWYGIEPFADLPAAEARIAKLIEMRRAATPAYPWAIELKSTGAFIGTCGLFAWNKTWRKCQLGYEICKEAEGQGYMIEAVNVAIDWAFQQMSLHRIEAQTHPNNRRSIALLARIGFKEEGRLRQAAFWSGQYHDMLQFGLLEQDFDLSQK